MISVRHKITWLNSSFLGLMLAIDQLLLPMSRIGSISFKLSYFICFIWFMHWLVNSSNNRNIQREVSNVFLVFTIIISCIVIGEVWLTTSYPVKDRYEVIRSISAYILTAFAFGLGRNAKNFNLIWLVRIFIASIALNLIFIFSYNQLPTWVVDYYYPERVLESWKEWNMTSVEEILQLARPRGAFGNPNASMLLVNIIVLFIHLALRNRLLIITSHWIALIIIALPIVLAGILASRGEFIVSSTLAFLNYRLIVLVQGNRLRKRMWLLIFTAVLMVTIGAAKLIEKIPAFSNFERIVQIADTFFDPTARADDDSGLARPLNGFDSAWGRFSESPIFGAGISVAMTPVFESGTQYFHNDWLMVFATSGVLGACAFFWLMLRFAWPLGWPVIIPFFFPGLLNSFLLNIPAFMVYMFLIGVLRAKLEVRS